MTTGRSRSCGPRTARAYLGTMAPGFPNFFMIYGPNMNAYGGLGVLNLEEMAVRYTLACIEHLVSTVNALDVTETAYWRWNDDSTNARAPGSTWIPERRATTRTSRPVGDELPFRRHRDVVPAEATVLGGPDHPVGPAADRESYGYRRVEPSSIGRHSSHDQRVTGDLLAKRFAAIPCEQGAMEIPLFE